MSAGAPVRFLVALGQALSSARLYAPEHPAREQAARDVWERAEELLREHSPAVFTFLEGEAALDDRRMDQLRDWPWSGELAAAGVERLELTAGLEPGEVEAFLERLSEILARPGEEDGAAQGRWRHVRFGRLAQHDEVLEARGRMEGHLEELDELFEQAETEGVVSTAVAETIVDTIAEAIRQAGDLLKLLVPLKDVDQYSTVHSMNVSVLSIGFAEQQGFEKSDIRKVGESALLHDLGKCLIPEEILQKQGPLTESEWKLIRQHPADGARILIRSRDGLLLPAVVAYEHHMYLDGSGYPPRIYGREPHPVSQLIQICDIFDALRTRRPFREGWPLERIVEHLEEGAGTQFDPETVRAFNALLRRWDTETEEDRAEEEPSEEVRTEEEPEEPAEDRAGEETPERDEA